MIVVGLAMFRFFSRNPNDLYAVIGIGAFCISALVIGKGITDFIRIKKDLSLMEKIILDHRRELIESLPPAPEA
jgi:putative membrane protein